MRDLHLLPRAGASGEVELGDDVRRLRPGDRVLVSCISGCGVCHGLSDEEALLLAAVLPTGNEVGVLAGSVRPGDVVAAVGAGPAGSART